MRNTVAVVLLSASLSACTPGAIAGALDVLGGLAKTAQGAQYLGSLLEEARAHSDLHFNRHPNLEAEGAVGLAFRDAQSALAAYNAAARAAKAAEDGELDATQGAALEAYAALRELLERHGVLSGEGTGGADGIGPDPGPLELPTPDELQARL